MKKLIILSLVVMAAFTVAFISKPQPSFQEATEEAYGKLQGQLAILSGTSSRSDSVNAYTEIRVIADDFCSAWDVEAERLIHLTGCQYQCALNYLNRVYQRQLYQETGDIPPPTPLQQFYYCVNHCPH